MVKKEAKNTVLYIFKYIFLASTHTHTHSTVYGQFFSTAIVQDTGCWVAMMILVP